MKPMTICRENPDLYKLTYPLYATPKLDGIRCVIVNGKPMTRTLKNVPNKFINDVLSHKHLEGLDGELIVGPANGPKVYRDTSSFVMSDDKVGDFHYYIFDKWNSPERYKDRVYELEDYLINQYMSILPIQEIKSVAELADYESRVLESGFEGLILRSYTGEYKFGRTTMREQNTYKLKRFVDGEAIIYGYEEEMHNGNEATTNELGRTQRSTHQANLRGKGTLGSLLVSDKESGVRFSIGSGFDAELRRILWEDRDKNLNAIVKYKHFPIGAKDKPRHPIFLGFRDERDM